jgi:hypothetical protein
LTLVVPLALVGCATEPGPRPGTGAAEAARDFFGALCQRDWPRAYGLLAPETRRRWSAEQFAGLATNYRKAIGMDPAAVHVRSCEEQGSEAVAHVVLTGAPGHAQHKDAVALRRSEAGWGVHLPRNFGQQRLR